MVLALQMLLGLLVFVVLATGFEAVAAGFGALFTLIGWAFKGFFAFIGFIIAIAAVVAIIIFLTNIIYVI